MSKTNSNIDTYIKHNIAVNDAVFNISHKVYLMFSVSNNRERKLFKKATVYKISTDIMHGMF